MNNTIVARDKSKSPERALSCRLAEEVGLCPAQTRAILDIWVDHLQDYHSDVRAPGTIVHTAVSAHEPPGKPIKHCTVVPVKLDYFLDVDIDVQRHDGTVELRKMRLLRFTRSAQRQGGLLSYEDLSILLGVDTSTVRDYVAHLRRCGIVVPTRGAIKDIGPEPSHKEIIAELLAKGMSTRKIRAATGHTESSIARYQAQFALVIHLMHHYPDASDDERWQVSDLSRKAYDTYAPVARELADNDAYRPHLERLRRRYEIDPEAIGRTIPRAKFNQTDPAKRLAEQTLDTVIRQTVQDDMGTTRRIAEVVATDIMKVVDDSFRVTESIRPGEVVIFVDAHDSTMLSGERCSNRAVMPVRVPVFTEQAKEIWREEEKVGRRRAKIAVLIASSAAEQGGVMSISALAELLHIGPGTLSKDLRELAVDLHVNAPTKGLLEDAGATLTHKNEIIFLDNCGLTGDEISWLSRHAPMSRDRYIETFRRAESLMRLEGQIPQAPVVARLFGLRLHVAQQYVDLLERYHGEGKNTPPFDASEPPDYHTVPPAAVSA